MSPEFLTAVIGALVILVGTFVVMKCRAWWRADDRNAAHYALSGVFIAVITIVMLHIFLLAFGGQLQSFARSSVAKNLALPLVFVVFAVSFLRQRRVRAAHAYPAWFHLLWVVTGTSFAVSVLSQRQVFDPIAAVQATAFVVGLLLSFALGYGTGRWTAKQVTAFLGVMGVAGAVAEILDVTLTPFSVLQVPIGFALIFVGLRAERHRLLALVVGAFILAPNAVSLAQNPNASIAVIAQFAACMALLCVYFLPSFTRVPLLAAGAALVLSAFVALGYWRMFVGESDLRWDVTLSHRAFEAAIVKQGLVNPVTAIFGLGPGATVDLSMSPDVVTLLSSGRDVYAVDDVHLLTSWLLLKFGILGLVWLMFFLFSYTRVVVRALGRERVGTLDATMLMFVSAAVIASVPAATYLFSNVLMAFCLGVLMARQQVAGVGEEGLTSTRRSHRNYALGLGRADERKER